MEKRLTVQKLSDKIAEVLEERIINGVYAVGERLPAERQLAEEFGVSRPPLRDALSLLAARQLLEARPGGGHYVSAQLHQDFLSGWQHLLDRHDYLRDDVLDFRRYLEGTLASMAAVRRTDADLSRMHFWLVQMRESAGKTGVEKLSEADVSFHQSIAEAAHNVLFAQLSGSLLRMLHHHTQTNLANMFGKYDWQPQLQSQHQALYEAIKKRQPKKAADLAHAHIDFVAQTLKETDEAQKRSHLSQTRCEQDERRAGK